MPVVLVSLALIVAIAALWWVGRRVGGTRYRGRDVDAPSDGSTWSGLDAEVDGIRFDRSKGRIELWRRSN